MIKVNKAEIAKNLFVSGFLCAPSVFSTFSRELGLDYDTALKIATGFGAGIGRQSMICGAVTGAIMAIGLKYGRASTDERDVQLKTYQLVNDFLDEFKADNDSIECRELAGYYLANPVELEKARESGVFKDICPKLVHSATEILDKMFKSGCYDSNKG